MCGVYCSVLQVLSESRITGKFPMWHHQLRASAAMNAAWRGGRGGASGSGGVQRV